MRATDRFIARVDAKEPETLTQKELRTRLELLEAEFSQLDHDEEHCKTETYGEDRWFHLRAITRERSAALTKKARLTALLESPAT